MATFNTLRLAASCFDSLANNGAHSFAARHALVHYASNSIYTFIPKNGCTTLRYALARGNGCITGVDDFEWIHRNNATFQASLRDLITAQYSFVVLRCPYRRLVSFYLDKVIKGVAPATQLLATEQQAGFEQPLEHLTFEQLVALISDESIRKRNNHWRNQSDFLVFETYSDYFCLEKMRDAVAVIEQKTGLDIVDTRQFVNHGLNHLTTIDNGYLGDVPAAEISKVMQSGFVPSYGSFFNGQSQAQVASAYADDLALYNDKFGAKELLFSGS